MIIHCLPGCCRSQIQIRAYIYLIKVCSYHWLTSIVVVVWDFLPLCQGLIQDQTCLSYHIWCHDACHVCSVSSCAFHRKGRAKMNIIISQSDVSDIIFKWTQTHLNYMRIPLGIISKMELISQINHWCFSCHHRVTTWRVLHLKSTLLK